MTTQYNIASLLDQQRCLICDDLNSKKAVIEKLSRLIASDLVNVEHKDLFFDLIEREKLGSTAIGHGIAIPHTRSEKINTPIGALIKLSKPLDFNSDDNVHTDTIFGLIVPQEQEESHLQILSSIASLFSKKESREQLRSCSNSETLFNTMIELSKQELATFK